MHGGGDKGKVKVTTQRGSGTNKIKKKLTKNLILKLDNNRWKIRVEGAVQYCIESVQSKSWCAVELLISAVCVRKEVLLDVYAVSVEVDSTCSGG